MLSVEEILARAMALSSEERARIAHELLRSLDEPADDDVEGAWVAEIEKRARAVEDGTAELEDWHEVRDRIRARFQTNP
jgi:putative addiction module component (TIGR02574 family)